MRNDVKKLRQHDFWRVHKWPFTDSDGPHPPIKSFRRRFGIDHEGASFQRLGASYGGPEKRSTDTTFPTCWINKQAVKQCDPLKRGWCHCDDANDLARILLGQLHVAPRNQWQSYCKSRHYSVDERLVIARLHGRTHTQARQLTLFFCFGISNKIGLHYTSPDLNLSHIRVRGPQLVRKFGRPYSSQAVSSPSMMQDLAGKCVIAAAINSILCAQR